MNKEALRPLGQCSLLNFATETSTLDCNFSCSELPVTIAFRKQSLSPLIDIETQEDTHKYTAGHPKCKTMKEASKQQEILLMCSLHVQHAIPQHHIQSLMSAAVVIDSRGAITNC
ncbi:hypothetical protein CEXT_164151 [Caerostris extrusa]|uniref:Uncharacterized protein n=1 Tax=Caerostris extrusa TaxID=172846 RepID=A0AAV4PC68_CAEEX|nr:hypothetical protein CEXT_164151 [Caerostris extrusa]